MNNKIEKYFALPSLTIFEYKEKYGFDRVIFHCSLDFKDILTEIPNNNIEVKAYGVNMYKLFETFEKAVNNLLVSIQKDKKLTSVFNQNIRPNKHWVWHPNNIKFKWVD